MSTSHSPSSSPSHSYSYSRLALPPLLSRPFFSCRKANPSSARGNSHRNARPELPDPAQYHKHANRHVDDATTHHSSAKLPLHSIALRNARRAGGLTRYPRNPSLLRWRRSRYCSRDRKVKVLESRSTRSLFLESIRVVEGCAMLFRLHQRSRVERAGKGSCCESLAAGARADVTSLPSLFARVWLARGSELRCMYACKATGLIDHFAIGRRQNSGPWNLAG